MTFCRKVLYNKTKSACTEETVSESPFSGKCRWVKWKKKGACSLLRRSNYGRRLQNIQMEELYAAIEKKIKDSGYPRLISGEDVYNDICDQIDGKENGTYILLSKFDDDVVFEYHITVMDDDFNLGVLTMRTPEGVFETDFDE